MVFEVPSAYKLKVSRGLQHYLCHPYLTGENMAADLPLHTACAV
mgnify:CR=1 FL=1